MQHQKSINMNDKPKLRKTVKFVDEGTYGWIFTQDTPPNNIKAVNELGAFIIRLCDGEHKVQSIFNKLVEKFPNIPQKTLEHDFLTFLNKCIRMGVIEI